MINTHEKFLKTVMEVGDLHEVMKLEGYKGTKEEVITDLIYALVETTAYVSDSRRVSDNKELTQEEYFEMLVKEMNINY